MQSTEAATASGAPAPSSGSPEPSRASVSGVAVGLVATAAAFVVLSGVREMSDIIAPLFFTLNLFIAAWPVRTFLVDHGAPKWVGTLALGAVVFLILIGFFWALGWAVSALVSEIPQYQSEFNDLYDQVVTWLSTLGITEDAILNQLRNLSPSNLTGLASTLFSGLSGFASLMSVMVVMMFMMALDSSTFDARGAILRNHRRIISVGLGDFVHGVRQYWIVSTIFGLIVAVIDVGVLLYLGVPLAFVWGIVAFLTNYIPNVGFIIGTVPPVVMALLANGPRTALITAVAYLVINFVIQSLIQPKFNGDAVGVTAVVSFISLLLWSAILGPLGALVGLPATLLIKAMLIDHNPNARWLNAFIASDTNQANPTDAGHPVHDEEMVALYDAAGRPTGKTAPRSEVRRKNLRHAATAIVVRNSAGQIFVHRRTDTKDVFPGLHDFAAGGVITGDESPDASARRELSEELGIDATLRRVGEGTYADEQTDYQAFLYMVTWDGTPTLQPEEVSWGDWMSLKDLRSAIDDGSMAFVPDTLALWRERWDVLAGEARGGDARV